MGTSRKTRIQAILATGIAIAAAGYLVVAITNDGRHTGDDCLSVDRGLIDLIASRSADGLTPKEAAAVEDPFARGRRSVSYDRYYIIVMELPTQGSPTEVGAWGLGTNSPNRTGGASSLSESGPIDRQGASLGAINGPAQQWADWPNEDIPITDSDPMMTRARKCLEDV